MILADKIIKLRKQNAWSQEELAYKVNVSRQSVSKWESAQSIPDLSKIIILADLFQVSVDFLVKDEMEEDRPSNGMSTGILTWTLEEVDLYMSYKEKQANIIAKGVAICILSFIPLVVLRLISKTSLLGMTSTVSWIAGIVLLFLIGAYGIAYLLRTNRYTDEIQRFETSNQVLAYGVKSIYKDRYDKVKGKHHEVISQSIVLLILSIVPIITTIILNGRLIDWMIIITLLLLLLALYRIIYIINQSQAYKTIIEYESND